MQSTHYRGMLPIPPKTIVTGRSDFSAVSSFLLRTPQALFAPRVGPTLGRRRRAAEGRSEAFA